MPRLSIIIPAYNAEKYLSDALESIVMQSSEDFEVIIVNDGSTDSTGEIIEKYCNEYEDFVGIDIAHSGIAAARNRGFKAASGEYVLFLDADDTLIEKSVESFLEGADIENADIVTGRCWYSGDIEPYFEPFADAIALLPKIDKYSRSFLWHFEIGNKVFKRKALINHNIEFPEINSMSEAVFLMKAVFAGLRVDGVAGGILDSRVHLLEDGFSKNEEPSYENLCDTIEAMNTISLLAKNAILLDTGNIEGDEYYLQEVAQRTLSILIDKFYRYLWHLEDRTLERLKKEIEAAVEGLHPERVKKYNASNKDLGLPFIYLKKEDAAKEPSFSFLVDIKNSENLGVFINSLYLQTFPFFELFIKQSHFESGYFPEKWKSAPNITVLPDQGFFSTARQKARSRLVINLKDSKSFDFNVLKVVYDINAPMFLKPILFSHTKNKFNIKKTLKAKGIEIPV